MDKAKVAKKKGAAALGVAGASAAGLAATYFFFGPNGKKNQKQAKAWAIKMKGEIVEKLENAKEVAQPAYHEIVEIVGKEFKKAKKASQPEIDALVTDLKKHWKVISSGAQIAEKEAEKTTKKVTKVVAKAATRAAKK